MNLPAPTRATVRQTLVNLIAGHISKEQASDWASAWVIADDPDVDDPVVWAALQALSGADLKIGQNEYLHTRADFAGWLDNLDAGGSR